MKNLFILTFTIISGLSFILKAQECPSGLVWNENLGQCVSPSTMPENDVKPLSCDPGLTYISFKNKCANDQEVRKVYDSLKVRYMREPMKKGSLTYVSTGTTMVVPVTASEQEAIKTQQADLQKKQQELAEREAQLNEQEQLAQQGPRTESANAEQAAQMKEIMSEMAAMKSELSSLRAQVSNLTVQTAKAGSAPVIIGNSSESLYKANIYGKTGQVEFNIECPNGYDWIADKQICLNSKANAIRLQALAQDPNAKPSYTDRDVKCPRYFIWNGAMQNCKPTVSAIKQ